MIELHCHSTSMGSTRVEIGHGTLEDLTQLEGRVSGDSFTILDIRCVGDRQLPERALEVAGGENLKSFATLERVLTTLIDAGLGRDATLIAVGGGSVGDLGGLAASLFMRGIGLRQVPTTLLSMVDSSVGGKTAINLPTGKNLVGTFWPASEVWIDTAFLQTLPDAEYASGLGEVLKTALGLDADLLELCEREVDRIGRRDPELMIDVVARCIRAKINIVESDAREAGARRLLNLGHTLGHAIESHHSYTMPHGIAVARGLHYAIDLSEKLSTLQSADAERMRTCLTSFGFERTPLPDRSALEPYVARDKKRIGANIHAVLLDGIGSCRTQSMSVAEFMSAVGK